jgi:16S rRNA processing protein RimM
MTSSAPSQAPKRLCVGVVAGPHGIRGGLRIKSFTAVPADVAAYGPVSDEAGARAWDIRVTGEQKGVVLAKLDGVTTREAAEALKGLRLYIDRDKLPASGEEEYYHADLIGLPAVRADGSPFGTVVAAWAFGAGDSLEIELPDGGTVMLPFTHAAVPVVDLAAGRITVEPPVGLFEKPEPPAAIEDQAAMAAEMLGSEEP